MGRWGAVFRESPHGGTASGGGRKRKGPALRIEEPTAKGQASAAMTTAAVALPGARRFAPVDAACWAVLAAMAGCVYGFFEEDSAPIVLTAMLGAPFVAVLHLWVLAASVLPSATATDWREQLAASGVPERTWWRRTLGPLFARAFLPAFAIHALLVLRLGNDRWGDIPAREWPGVAAMTFMLQATICMAAAIGAMRAFRALCRPRRRPTSVAATMGLWVAAGIGAPISLFVFMLATRSFEELAPLGVASVFLAALPAALWHWRRGWGGIFAFE